MREAAPHSLLVEEVKKAVREAVAEALNTSLETLNVEEAAKLLKTTPGAIYVRHKRGQMPRRLPGRRLVWRKADLLKVEK